MGDSDGLMGDHTRNMAVGQKPPQPQREAIPINTLFAAFRTDYSSIRTEFAGFGMAFGIVGFATTFMALSRSTVAVVIAMMWIVIACIFAMAGIILRENARNFLVDSIGEDNYDKIGIKFNRNLFRGALKNHKFTIMLMLLFVVWFAITGALAGVYANQQLYAIV